MTSIPFSNFMIHAQAITLFLHFLNEVDDYVQSKTQGITQKELEEISQTLLPILQLYGIVIPDQEFTTDIAKSLYEKIQSAVAISDVLQTISPTTSVDPSVLVKGSYGQFEPPIQQTQQDVKGN